MGRRPKVLARQYGGSKKMTCPTCEHYELETEPNANSPQTFYCPNCSSLYYLDNQGKLYKINY